MSMDTAEDLHALLNDLNRSSLVREASSMATATAGAGT
jgi:hypothetical protein